jgi:hypothetical protein
LPNVTENPGDGPTRGKEREFGQGRTCKG